MDGCGLEYMRDCVNVGGWVGRWVDDEWMRVEEGVGVGGEFGIWCEPSCVRALVPVRACVRACVRARV
eukprot:6214675-Pleurochrysis_carterae.AAC.6